MTAKKEARIRAKFIKKKVEGFKVDLMIDTTINPNSLNVSIGAWAGSLNNSYKEDLYEFKKLLKHNVNQMVRKAFRNDKYVSHILVCEGAEDSKSCVMKNKLAFLSIELVLFFDNRIEFGGVTTTTSFDGVDDEALTLVDDVIKLMTSVDWFVVKPSKK